MIVMDLEQLQANIAAKRPIEDASLSGVDWTYLDCEDATFTGCLIDRGQFSNVILAGAKFSRCQLPACRFSRSDLSDAEFQECGFAVRDDEPAGGTFVFSDLRRAKFTRCDLSLGRFERSDLFAVEMDQCNLRGARFHKADFSHAYSRKLVVTRATFRGCNLEFADLAEARLAECDFTESRFREADLTAVDFTDAVLRDGDLFRAELAGAKLEGADLRGAELSGLNLLNLASFARMKITQSQQHGLLQGVGIDVYPEPP